jgi:hypothetical protein
MTKFGKRPVYVFSFILYTATTFGAGACKTWGSQLALRIVVSLPTALLLLLQRLNSSTLRIHRLVPHLELVSFLVQ